MISIYTITSALHDENAVSRATAEFLDSLAIEFTMRGADFSSYGADTLSLIYVRTGGTENIFKSQLETILAPGRPVYLLTSGRSNSLAASMEILSYLRSRGIPGEIIHGDPSYIKSRIERLALIEKAFKGLSGKRLGVIGKPSDWLISSACDYEVVKSKTGMELVDIEISELIAEIEAVRNSGTDCGLSGYDVTSEAVRAAVPDAVAIYHALKALIARHSLNGLTIRCFDLLDTVHNTGCYALAKLNAEGIPSSCEGDIPALLTMVIAQALTGRTGFQANPSRINPETGEMVFAHCTVPFNMIGSCILDSHFESGIGVGIRGHVKEGPVTVFKVSGSLDRVFAEEGTIERNLSVSNLCRTQVVLRLDRTDYFLNNPIGNHHIIVPGSYAALFREFMQF